MHAHAQEQLLVGARRRKSPDKLVPSAKPIWSLRNIRHYQVL
jgi:hypothetical protein